MSRLLFPCLKHLIFNCGGLHIQNRNFLKLSLPSISRISRYNFTEPVACIYRNKVDDLIERLDEHVRRVGRSSLRNIKGILEEGKRLGVITPPQALLLIRSSGSLLIEEKPEKRSETSREIWLTLQQLDTKLDISHYNALLRVYLDNEYSFKPTDILLELDEKGIEPNRVTCQRLISRYCQMGDIAGAMNILEFMREKSMPVNESVFNALILGHSKTKNMENAENILRIMSDGGIKPSEETYTILITGYINNGNLKKADEWLNYCESRDLRFTETHYFNIIFTLVQNGHEEKADEILPRLRKSTSYSTEAINFVFKLLSADLTDIAFKILKSMDKLARPDGTILPIGNFFINHLVKNNQPTETVLKYCYALMVEKMNSRALHIAMESSLRCMREDVAFELFKAAKKLNEPIRYHFFWPILVNRGKKMDIDGILDVVSIMREEYEINLNTETLRGFIIPYMIESGVEIDDLIEKIKICDISTGIFVGTMVMQLVKNGMGRKAAEIVLHYPTAYIPRLMRLSLNNYLLQTNDVNSYIILLKDFYIYLYFSEFNQEINGKEDDSKVIDHRTYLGDTLGYAIVELISRNVTEVVEKLIKAAHDNRIGISQEKVETLENIVKDVVSPETLHSLKNLSCEKFVKPARKKTAKLSWNSVNDVNMVRLEEELLMKGESPTGIRKRLFSLYSRNKDLEKLLQLKEKLETEGEELTTTMQIYLMDAYIENGKFQEALDVYQKLKELSPDWTLNTTKTLCVGYAAVQTGNLDKMWQMLKEKFDSNEPVDEVQEVLMDSSFSAWKLLNLLAEKGEEKMVENVFNILAPSKYIVVSRILSPLIKVHLIKGDTETALQAFTRCVENYQQCPSRSELCECLLKIGDENGVQKVIDLDALVHGEMNARCNALLLFLETGRLNEARELLQTRGIRFLRGRLETVCEKYVNNNKVDHIVNLLKITNGIASIDQSIIYKALLKIRSKNNDIDGAMALWTEMQEIDAPIKDDFLNELAELLIKNGLSVPFAVPEKRVIRYSNGRRNYQESKELRRRDSKSRYYPGSEILFLLESENYDEAKRLFNEHRMKTGSLPVLKVLKPMLIKASVAGDIEFIEELDTLVPSDIKKFVSFDNRRALAYFNVNRGEEYVSALEENFKKAQEKEQLPKFVECFPRSLLMIQENDQLFSRVKALAEKCMELDSSCSVLMSNLLWVAALCQKNFQEADVLWSTHLKSERKLTFITVLNEMRKRRDVEIGEKLLSYYEEKGENASIVGIIYSSIISTHLDVDNVDEAMNVVKRALSKIDITSLQLQALQSLKNACENKNLQFPYQLPIDDHILRFVSSKNSI